MVTEAGMREESYVCEWRDAKPMKVVTGHENASRNDAVP
jgi:hypothetical protein